MATAMSTSMSFEPHDAQMLDFPSDIDVQMYTDGSGANTWTHGEVAMEDAGIDFEVSRLASPRSEHSVEIEMDEPYGQEYEMADEESYPQEAELHDVEVYDVSENHPSLGVDHRFGGASESFSIPSEVSSAIAPPSAFPDVFTPQLSAAPSGLPDDAESFPVSTSADQAEHDSNVAAEVDQREPSSVPDGEYVHKSLSSSDSAPVTDEYAAQVQSEHEGAAPEVREASLPDERVNVVEHDTAEVSATQVEDVIDVQESAEVSRPGDHQQTIKEPREVEAHHVQADATYEIQQEEEQHPTHNSERQSEGDPHEISEGVYIDPPPAVLISIAVLDDVQVALFNHPADEGSSSKQTTDVAQQQFSVMLDQHPTLYYEPLNAVFEALRQEELISQLPGLREAELVLDAFDLHLSVDEDNVWAREITLHNLNEIHDGSGLLGPLRLRLSLRIPRFVVQYHFLRSQLGNLTLAINERPSEGEVAEEAHATELPEVVSSEYVDGDLAESVQDAIADTAPVPNTGSDPESSTELQANLQADHANNSERTSTEPTENLPASDASTGQGADQNVDVVEDKNDTEQEGYVQSHEEQTEASVNDQAQNADEEDDDAYGEPPGEIDEEAVPIDSAESQESGQGDDVAHDVTPDGGPDADGKAGEFDNDEADTCDDDKVISSGVVVKSPAYDSASNAVASADEVVPQIGISKTPDVINTNDNDSTAVNDIPAEQHTYNETEYDKIVENPEEHDDWDDFDDENWNDAPDAASNQSSTTLSSFSHSTSKRRFDEVDLGEDGEDDTTHADRPSSTDFKRTRVS